MRNMMTIYPAPKLFSLSSFLKKIILPHKNAKKPKLKKLKHKKPNWGFIYSGLLFSSMFKFTHLPENEKDKYDELRKAALERYKFFIKKIEERYIKHGKGKYFLGDRFTLCDILVGAQLPAFCDRFNEQVVPQVSPALAELIKRLMNEELKEFHEKYFYKTQP